MPIGAELGVGIVGCGLIGQRRAHNLPGARLVACADAVEEHALALACATPGAVAETNWHRLLDRRDIDAIVVCTTHDALAAITLESVLAGKHVLVEKPGARRAAELAAIIEAQCRTGVVVRVGFNHRYHPAICRARELCDQGELGELMFIRGRYGHGGRPGYEREWRANPERSGGGELIDQGVHLIDLARWFLGDFVEVQGFAHTYFWDMPVEDNGFLLLRTQINQTAFLHASCTEWKNLFSFEIYGRRGKLDVSGLGGSYGTERVTFFRMLPEMGPPETTMWEYPGADLSWHREFSAFAEDIRSGRPAMPGLGDAYAALRVVERVYEVSGR